jgi:hypothetical protein
MISTLWKCRLCSAVTPGEASQSRPLDELNARIAAPTKAARIGTHDCRPGVVGVTDLVGATDDKKALGQTRQGIQGVDF